MIRNSLKINLKEPPLIKRKIKHSHIKRFYENHLTNGYMHPAQWFRDPEKWYRIHTFNNPYNIGRPNAELALIIESKEKIKNDIRDMPIVFWGVGKSDTEMELVNLQLEKNSERAHLIAVDVNYRFVRDFANALKDITKERDEVEIYFLGIQSLFENIAPPQLNCFNRRPKMHICLGNAIGNYEDIRDVLKIFRRNVKIGNRLMVGIQTDNMIQAIVRRYSGNKYLENMIKSSLYPSNRALLKSEAMEWKYNESKGQIEAWVGGIQLFRSKKFNPNRFEKIMSGYGFRIIKQYADKFTTCIQIYEHI